jgi:hypothetical protein
VLLGQNVADGQSVSGTVGWQVQAASAVRVDFVVDGSVRASASSAPYLSVWDAAAEIAGMHVLTARAVGDDMRAVEASVTVTLTPTSPPAP